MQPTRIVTYVMLVVFPPAALGIAILVLEKMSLTPSGNIGHLHAASLLTVISALIPLVLLLLGFIALAYVKNRMVGMTMVMACVAFTLMASTITNLQQGLRNTAFEKLVARADTLVQAIHQFEHIRGNPPDKLSQLVPQYIREIPATGLGAYPAFKYQRLTDPNPMPDSNWMLVLPISTSPQSRLVYLPERDYETLSGTKEPLANWVHVYQLPPGREQPE